MALLGCLNSNYFKLLKLLGTKNIYIKKKNSMKSCNFSMIEISEPRNVSTSNVARPMLNVKILANRKQILYSTIINMIEKYFICTVV